MGNRSSTAKTSFAGGATLSPESHLRLGITRQGLLELMKKELDFEGPERFNMHDDRKKIIPPERYERPGDLYYIEQDLQEESYNAVRHNKTMRGKFHTGYDFAQMVREWLKGHGHERSSVCEVLLREGSPHVKAATVFYSHVQRFPMRHVLKWMYISEEDGRVPRDSVYWFDFLTLRQCQPDFDLAQIRLVIEAIGRTLVELQPDGHVLPFSQRLFCLYELYCTVNADKTIAFACTCNIEEIILAYNPINSAAADARFQNDKETIREAISKIGFTAFNEKITASLKKQAQQRGRGGDLNFYAKREKQRFLRERVLREKRNGASLEEAGQEGKTFRETFHVSCSSARFEPDANFFGIVVWSPTPQMAKSIKPGYIHIKKTAGENDMEEKIGMARDLVKLAPEQIAWEGGIIDGFSIMGSDADGAIKLTPVVGNAHGKDESKIEAEAPRLVQQVIEKWKTSCQVSFNM